ncbi:hypothetical protein XbC2_19 [Xanthomonas phage XbC2]|nr:hypothetical protein XbC2_19 [Xanthomonas phage XbC2]
MGQNVHGLPYGVANALNELAKNVKTGPGAARKYRTEDDYYNEFVRRNGNQSGFPVPKDALRKRLYKRAKERYNKDHPREYKLKTVNDMVMFLANNGQITALWQHVGLDIERHEMAKKAIDIYQTGKGLLK